MGIAFIILCSLKLAEPAKRRVGMDMRFTIADSPTQNWIISLIYSTQRTTGNVSRYFCHLEYYAWGNKFKIATISVNVHEGCNFSLKRIRFFFYSLTKAFLLFDFLVVLSLYEK